MKQLLLKLGSFGLVSAPFGVVLLVDEGQRHAPFELFVPGPVARPFVGVLPVVVPVLVREVGTYVQLLLLQTVYA